MPIAAQPPNLLLLMALCAALSWLPGYGLLAHVRRLSPGERLACSGPLSAVLAGTVALACFLLGAPTWPALLLPLAAGLCGIALARRRGLSLAFDEPARQIGRFWLLFLTELLLLEAVLPTFGGADWLADWWVHFHRSLVYANLVSVSDLARTCSDPHLHCVAPVYDKGVLTARTPLYNLLCAIPLGLTRGALAAFQVGAAVWSAVLAGPVVLLAQRRGLHAGRLAGLLLLLNPFLVHLAIYPWPKVLTAAFEVLAVYWLLRARDGARFAGAAAMFSLGLAVFSHTAGIIYLFAALFYLAGVRRPSAAEWRGLIAGLALALLVALPWISWGVHTYGWRGVLLSSPTTRSDQPPVAVAVVRKVNNLVDSFVPMPFAHFLAVGPFSSPTMGWLTGNAVLEISFDTYPGAVGLVVCALLLRWYAGSKLSRDTRRLGWSIVVCAAIGSAVLDPAELDSGAAVNALAGAVALGLVLLAVLAPARRYRTILIAVGLEMMAVYALYLGYLSVGPWTQDPNTRVLAGMGQQMLSAVLGPTGLLGVAMLLSICCLGALGLLARPFVGQHLPVGAIQR